MFEGRAAQVDLASLLSTGDARGANSFILSMCLICVKIVAADVVHLSTLSFAVSLSMKLFFQSTQLSGCAELGR